MPTAEVLGLLPSSPGGLVHWVSAMTPNFQAEPERLLAETEEEELEVVELELEVDPPQATRTEPRATAPAPTAVRVMNCLRVSSCLVSPGLVSFSIAFLCLSVHQDGRPAAEYLSAVGAWPERRCAGAARDETARTDLNQKFNP